MRGKHGATERAEEIDTKLGRLVIPKTAVATVVVLGIFALSQVTNAVLASEPAPQGAPTPTPTPTTELTPEPEPTPEPESEPEPTATPPVSAASSNPVPDEAQRGGLFSEVDGAPPPTTDVETLASRLVGIDFGQIAEVTKSPVGTRDPVTGTLPKPQTLVLNLFDDVAFTGIVEHVEPTSSGHSLWGRLNGVELGTMTLVVNGSVVVGTVRTPDAVYTIRTVGDAYVVRQIDESSLPPLGEPLNGHSPTPDARPPSPPQGRGPTEPAPPGRHIHPLSHSYPGADRADGAIEPSS